MFGHIVVIISTFGNAIYSREIFDSLLYSI